MKRELSRAGPGVPPSARAVLLAAGVAWALVAEAIRLGADWPVPWVLGDLIPGLTFLVCGYVAWQRDPEGRLGSLMMATGFAWYVGTAATSQIHVVDWIASSFQGFYDPLLAWLILAYPSGRLSTRSTRTVVALFFFVIAAMTVFRLLVFPSTAGLDVSDPAAVDRYVADVTLREDGRAIFRALIAFLAVAVLVLVIGRWRTETPAGRAVAGPILLAGLGFAVGIVVETLAVAGSQGHDDRVLAWDFGQWVTVVTASMIPIAFLVGVGQDRLARGRVADLVVGLRDTASGGGEVQEALRQTLGDASLIVGYAVGTTDRFVDLDGQPIELGGHGADRALTRVDRGGRTIAALVHDPALVARPELMTSIAAVTGLALENERLQAELRVQLAEVRASRARIVAAADAERRRVERDLHDGAQQRFVTLALVLQLAKARIGTGDGDAAAMLDRATAELEHGLAELRELARGIHPTVLTEDGLAAAIRVLAERAAPVVTVAATDRRFEAAVETTAYYVVAEAVTNVAKHARGASVSVLAEVRGRDLVIEIRDDGPGGAEATGGSGLAGLADRVAAVGGVLEVESPMGGGTVVRAVIPCA